MTAWYGHAPSKVRATKPVSTGRQHGSAFDADMRDEKVLESLRSPIQHCNDCGAPMQALCICESSPGETFGYNTDIDDDMRRRQENLRIRKEAARTSAIIRHCQKVASLPESERLTAVRKVPVDLRADVARLTKVEW